MQFTGKAKASIHVSTVENTNTVVKRKKTTLPKRGFSSSIEKLNKQVLRLVRGI